MKALSIRQPWAWLILNAGKDIENRSWPTKFRGRVLIHASKGMTHDEYDRAMEFAIFRCGIAPEQLPRPEVLERGGIIGSVEIVDCISHSESPWYMGEFGFVLSDPRPMTFVPYKGSLGFFNVPEIDHE